MGKEQQVLPACPFCGSDQVYEINQSMEKRDGPGVTFDAAECDSCCAQAPIDKWIAFAAGFAELKDMMRITREACEDAVRNTRTMSAQLRSLPDVTEPPPPADMHGD